MSDFPSYESIADRTLGDVTEPKIIPSGTWELEIENGSLQKPRSETRPTSAYFPCKLVRPTDNVSPAMLDDFTAEDMAVAEIGWDYPFWRESSIQRLKKTLVGLGVAGDDETPLPEFFKNAKGLGIAADVVHEHNNDEPDNPYIKLKNVRRVNSDTEGMD